MKANFYYLLFTLFLLSAEKSIAQKDTWKVFFPGYDGWEYKGSIDTDQTLNMVLSNNVDTGLNKFVSIDKNGFMVFQETTNEYALLNFKDDAGNRYLVSYLEPQLRIRKFDSQGALIWNQANTIANAIGIGLPLLDKFYLINSAQYLLMSNGNLAIAGLFQTDTVPGSVFYESLSVFIIDTTNGAILNGFNQCEFVDVVVNTVLQEDGNGNINVMYYNENSGYATLAKISANATFLDERIFGVFNGGIIQKAIKMTPNFIYVGIVDQNVEFNVLKLEKTTLDTVFYVNTLLQEWDVSPGFFEANDSSFYLSHAPGGALCTFSEYDFNGNIVCNDSSTFANYGYKFALQGSKCYSARENLSQRDTLCYLTNCSNTFDFNTQSLINGYLGNPGYPVDNYPGTDILYMVSKNQSYVMGVIGIFDEKRFNISGRLYFDVNGDCVSDSNEVGLQNQLIRIDPDGKFLFTGENGYYENFIDTGSYSLSAVPLNSALSLCPVSIPLTIADTTTHYGGNNFAVTDQTGNLQDLSININQIVAVPGMLSHIYLTARNHLPLPASGIICLTYDPNIFGYFFATVAPDSISGNQIYWHVNNIDFLNQYGIMVDFIVNSQTIAGTPFVSTATITNLTGEANQSNNMENFQGIVLSSYDPNDKYVYPRGYGINGVISPADSVLNYKIQFQNTGTYTAFKVVVIDTIDANLELSSFRLLSTSHPCQISFLDSNVIAFTFEDIMLPDSNINEPASHGFINYSISLKPNLAIGEQIKNKANIYFDFNTPVVTNETVNTIGTVGLNEVSVNKDIILFPNPAGNELNVVMNIKDEIAHLTILDIHGKEVYHERKKIGNSMFKIGINNLVSGYYFFKIETGKSVYVKPFVKQ